ncbi:MAG TPA: VCBS repeat-containing protein, partial [Acidobacteriota bacterium]|nr:VCBS repeat-containing protein [Acidobacteriota bacterium]
MINQSSLHRRVQTALVWVVCVFLLTSHSFGVLSAVANTRRRIQAGKTQVVPISVSAKGRGTPWVDFQDAVPASVDYVGQEAYVKAVAGGQARPLSIAVGDLNNDGTPDVVSGYASGSTGLLMVQKGTSTGLDRQGVIFPIQKAPYLLQVGEFTGDGNADVVAATSGEASLQVMRGDGFGGFAQPETVELSGTLISLTSTRNDSSLSPTLVVGLTGEKTSSLLVYSGGLKATPHTVSLPLDEPTHLAISMPDQQGVSSLGAATGETLMLVRGLGAKALKIKRTFDHPVQGLAFGHFTQSEKTEVAVLVSNGDVFVFSVDALFADATAEGVLFGRIPNPKGLAGLSVGHFAKDAAGLDDLLVMDRGTRKVYVLVANDLLNREDRTVTAEFDVSTRLVAVAPIQMTAGQPQELVILSLGPNVSLVSQTKKEAVVVTSQDSSSDTTVFAPSEKRPDLEVNPLYSPGKDGALTVNTAATIVNLYTTLTADAAAGATSITVANTTGTNRLVPTTHLTAGDLILIIQ